MNTETGARDTLDIRIAGIVNRARSLSSGQLYVMRKVGRHTDSFRAAARLSAWGYDPTAHREALEARAWMELDSLPLQEREIVFDAVVAEIYRHVLSEDEFVVLQRPVNEAVNHG